MLTIRKLESLPPRTRLRKLLLLIQEQEETIVANGEPALTGLLQLLSSPAFLGALQPPLDAVVAKERDLLATTTDALQKRRALNGLRHGIGHALGVEPAEWDLLLPGYTGMASPRDRRAYPMHVFLEDIRAPFNVGSMFRTAEAFGAARIYLSARTPKPTQKKAIRTSRGSHELVPWQMTDLRDLPSDLPVMALETDGTPIDEFAFPNRGLVLIGSEELGLTPEALRLAHESAGRVTIPMSGARRSLNVAVAFGIFMQRWHAHLARDSQT